MPVAPYDTDEYRAWNRERMRGYRRRIVRFAGHPTGGLSYATVEAERRTTRDRERRIERNLAKLEREGHDTSRLRRFVAA